MKVIAVDGPGGVGKTSVSRGVADQLGWAHLDTGAFYRAATVVTIVQRVDLAIEAEVLTAVTGADLGFAEGSMFVEGLNMDAAIRSDRVTAEVSRIAAYPSVRANLVDRQRRWVAEHPDGAVVEGRDIGTVVFPEAPLKVFLTARPEVRAARRAGETPHAAVSEVHQQLAVRDRADSNRQVSPLTAADDAVEVDTSDIGQDEVVRVIVDLAAERGLGA